MNTTNSKIKISEGQIVVPYNSNSPIMTLDNPSEDQVDLFIRARYHVGLRSWFAEIDGGHTGRAHDSKKQGQRGAVIFVPRVLKIGEGVVIRRVFGGGNSAQGTILELPDNVMYPFNYDTARLFKKEQPVITDTDKHSKNEPQN